MKVVKKEQLSATALIFGERARPGRSSARHRAEHEGVGRPKTVDPFQFPMCAARARPTAPEAGALPFPPAWFRLQRATILAREPSGQDVIIERVICEII
jgi:hypothetical protein